MKNSISPSGLCFFLLVPELSQTKQINMKYCVYDIETDGLLDKLSRFHCMCYEIIEDKTVVDSGTILDEFEAIAFLNEQEIIIAHNQIIYDIPALEKLTNLKIKEDIFKYDSLAVSYYLYNDRNKHGLASYGEDIDIPKPEIDDWENLSIGEYIYRCQEDVKINTATFLRQLDYLVALYGDNWQPIVKYLGFKMECLREQEEMKIPIHIAKAKALRSNLYRQQFLKVSQLINAMPRVPAKRTYPKKPYKKDGSPSATLLRWFDYLDSLGLPRDTTEVTVPGNPNSHVQLKKWLFDLGWEPQIFDVSKSTGLEVPQVSRPFGKGLCNSIKDLYEVEPALEALDGLYIINHRLGVVKGIIAKADENNRVVASANGFTNTLRLQHSKPIVNLPSPKKAYGKEIRELLITPGNNYIMVGSDVSGLEDTTKQHYMYYFDADYVTNMRVPGFDPHLDIALFAGIMTQEQVDRYKEISAIQNDERTQEQKDEFASLAKLRSDAKVINFSAVYGAGPAKIAKVLKQPLDYATKLHTAYWERNKAVKQVAQTARTKVVTYMKPAGNNRFYEAKQKWLFNPVSEYWYFLKEDKDKFSTLNQGTGAYMFDMWVYKVRQKGIKLCLQYHDEILTYDSIEQKEFIIRTMKEAMEEVNETIKLNVPLSISVEVGNSYYDCH